MNEQKPTERLLQDGRTIEEYLLDTIPTVQQIGKLVYIASKITKVLGTVSLAVATERQRRLQRDWHDGKLDEQGLAALTCACRIAAIMSDVDMDEIYQIAKQTQDALGIKSTKKQWEPGDDYWTQQAELVISMAAIMGSGSKGVVWNKIKSGFRDPARVSAGDHGPLGGKPIEPDETDDPDQQVMWD